MILSRLSIPLALLCATLAISPALAQSETPKAEDAQKEATEPTDQEQARQRRLNEFAEAKRIIPGPAGQPECVWFGRRVASLLWRDDLNTALQHLQMYDRFGCPEEYLQMTFRCLLRNGNIDPKVPESLPNRIHACWVDPTLQPADTAAAAQADEPKNR